MRKAIRWSVVALALVIVTIQFVRPARTNAAADPVLALPAVHPMSPQVAGVFDRACRDCHSNDTRWPWYSNVAPISWFVIDHVNHGRSHFNYSDWTRYDPPEATRLLKGACDLVREGAMPLRSYTWMHRHAHLSREDADALCSWAREAARTQWPRPSG